MKEIGRLLPDFYSLARMDLLIRFDWKGSDGTPGPKAETARSESTRRKLSMTLGPIRANLVLG